MIDFWFIEFWWLLLQLRMQRRHERELLAMPELVDLGGES